MLRRERGVATAQSSSTPLTACEFVEFAELVLLLIMIGARFWPTEQANRRMRISRYASLTARTACRTAHGT